MKRFDAEHRGTQLSGRKLRRVRVEEREGVARTLALGGPTDLVERDDLEAEITLRALSLRGTCDVAESAPVPAEPPAPLAGADAVPTSELSLKTVFDLGIRGAETAKRTRDEPSVRLEERSSETLRACVTRRT